MAKHQATAEVCTDDVRPGESPTWSMLLEHVPADKYDAVVAAIMGAING